MYVFVSFLLSGVFITFYLFFGQGLELGTHWLARKLQGSFCCLTSATFTPKHCNYRLIPECSDFFMWGLGIWTQERHPLSIFQTLFINSSQYHKKSQYYLYLQKWNGSCYVFKQFKILCVWVSSLPICLHPTCMPSTYRGQKREWDPLELELLWSTMETGKHLHLLEEHPVPLTAELCLQLSALLLNRALGMR